MKKHKVRYVDFLNNPKDFEVLVLGSLGQSTKSIIAKIGYSPCQISYRLHKQGIKRMAFRNGESELSKRVLGMVRPTAIKFLRQKYF